MHPRLSLRHGSWKIRSTPFTGSNETGRSRVNRSPTSNAWFSSGNVTNTSLEPAVFVGRVLERLEAADVLMRSFAMPQEHTEGCLERCGDEPARDDPDLLGGDAAGSLFQRRRRESKKMDFFSPHPSVQRYVFSFQRLFEFLDLIRNQVLAGRGPKVTPT